MTRWQHCRSWAEHKPQAAGAAGQKLGRACRRLQGVTDYKNRTLFLTILTAFSSEKSLTDYIRMYVGESTQNPSSPSNLFPLFPNASQAKYLTLRFCSRDMQAEEDTKNGEPATDGDVALDQYPLTVLEAVLNILKAQQGKSEGNPPRP